MRLKSIVLIVLSILSITNVMNAQNKDNKKVLIAYFSWSGNTKEIANQIQGVTGGDMFEIKRLKPYSTDYNTCVDEARLEKQQKARPAIAGKINNIDDYDIVFIGYPNWWGTLPMPVFTFMESYDFSGKTVIPFVTHGGGGSQDCFKDFEKLASKYEHKKGFICSGSVAKNAKSHVEKWVKEQTGISK